MAPDLRLCIVMLGLVCLTGCLGTHRVETSVYEGSEGAVFLRAVPVESRAASHPATLSIDTLKKVLQGIHFRQSGRLLQSLLNRDAAPTPLFSPSEIKFFAPHLQRAFSRATGRESVVIRMPAPSSSAFKIVTGMMVVNENTLHAAFTFSNKGSFTHTQSKVTPADHRGFTSPTLVFLPKDAVLKEAESPWYMPVQTRHRLLVDLSLLASAEGDSFTRDKEPASRTPFEAQSRQESVRPLVPTRRHAFSRDCAAQEADDASFQNVSIIRVSIRHAVAEAGRFILKRRKSQNPPGRNSIAPAGIVQRNPTD